MKTTDSTELAIAGYRHELEAEADLARDDVAELEDHLRSITRELLAAGATADQAFAEARSRLGEPRQIAREHLRVRSTFGAKLSRVRAWSAASLLLAHIVIGFLAYAGQSPYFGIFVVEMGLAFVLALALGFRLTWARAVIAGVIGYALVHDLIATVAYDAPAMPPIAFVLLAMRLGILAFVMPWRRGELGTAGIALALLAVVYMGANWVLAFEIYSPSFTMEIGFAHIALLSTIVAGIGLVMRARWSVIPAAIAACSLAMATSFLLDITFQFENAATVRVMLVGTVVAGALAAAACAVLGWRTARTTFGSLRGFVS